MIWLVAWIDFNLLLFAAILTPVRRREHSADVIDLSEQRRQRQGRRVRS